MLTSFSQNTINKSNVIEPMNSRIAVIPCIAVTINMNSRLNKAGFFIAASVQQMISFAQRLQVRVYDYNAISLLRKAANSTIKLLNKGYK